jgi:Protein kinase domain
MDSTADAARSLRGYEIIEQLGQGGFGTVYRARQLAVGREVALKIDNRVLGTDRDKRRFMREVTAAGRLSGHPHVVPVYDAGVLADGRPYMVLELCPAGSLADRLRDRGPFPAAEVRDIGVHIADALTAAHSAGVLHRDVKPANILVNGYGSVALADFGLAVVPKPGLESSATREALTPAYASPEVFNLSEPNPAGDVYALGATLYALLSGRPPYFPPSGPPSMVALMAARLGPVPDIPGAPPGLVAVLRRAMAYDPAERPRSAAALRDALASADLSPPSGNHAPYVPPAVVPGHPVRPPGDPAPPTQPSSGGRRNTLSGPLLAAAIVVAVAIVAAGALVAYSIGGGSGGEHTSGGGGGGANVAQNGGSSGTRAKDPYGGAETVTANCPAATVRGAGARCTKTAECWGGIVAINGNVSINRADCSVGHVYETFAIAPLPSDAQTWNMHTLEQNPTVRQVCSRDVMTRSRFGKALGLAPNQWSTEVIPPSQTQFEEQGLRTFRCVATVTGKQTTGTAFRPRV